MPANTSQAVLITGGAGFIGANLAATLVPAGHRVTVLDDLSAGDAANLEGVDAPLVTGSVLDVPLVDRLVAEHDAVVHLAGATAVPTPLATRWVLTHVNTTGTLNVLEAARHAGSHVTLASSAVYGSPTQMPVGRTCRSDRQVPTASVAHTGLRRGDPLRRSLAGLGRHASAREPIHCQMYPLWTMYT